MQLGGDVIQPFDGFIAGNTVYRCQQLAVGDAVGKILHNRYAFRQQSTIVQQQCRHLSLRVNGKVIVTVFETFFH